MSTVEQYTWEGSILDCSIGESATTTLPSAFIQKSADLTFDMGGPSWLDESGIAVFANYKNTQDDSRALLVRKTFLQAFLKEHKLELIAFHWFERMQIKDDYSGENPYVEMSVSARLTASLAVHQGTPRRTERDLE